MVERKDLPCTVLNDGRILLETEHPLFEEARESINRFAFLEESPEYVHTYQINNVSLWNAASLHDLKGEEIIQELEKYSKYPIPEELAAEICEMVDRWGKLVLRKPLPTESQFEGRLILSSSDPQFLQEVISNERIQPFIAEQPAPDIALIEHTSIQRGFLKRMLTRTGYPVQDQIGVEPGEELEIDLRSQTKRGEKFKVRDYQNRAVNQFLLEREYGGGYGVVLLPPGTGKTIVGMETLNRLKECALILCVDRVAVRQWIDELLGKTTLTSDQIGEYTGEKKQIRPVTVATYHIAIRSVREYLEQYGEEAEIVTHFQLFDQFNWGLIIYDEVHRLPAAVFRLTAELQARRRLGMTATFIREDEREDEVFSLIGPLRFSRSWQEMEEEGWIAQAICREIRIPLPGEYLGVYNRADYRRRFRIASENPRKLGVLREILNRSRPGDKILVMSYFLDQLERISREIEAPVINGYVSSKEREELYQAFRNGEIKVLCVSNVANYAIDLPDANVAVQVSGTFGSRQEEAQRLGRILRPKPGENIAQFYTLVTSESREEFFARRRQRFLTERGYNYAIQEEDDYV